MPKIRITPLGAGQDVGRSVFWWTIGGRNVMLDCGMHMGFSDDRRFPDFSYIDDPPFKHKKISSHIYPVSSFSYHCGALPYMTEMIGYQGPIYMTYPTKAIVPVLLEDFRKVVTEHRGETNFFTSAHVKACMKKVIAVNLHEIIQVDEQLTIQAFYAGHVLGAAMFMVKVGEESVQCLKPFAINDKIHLGAAKVPPGLCPDVLITETTYATTIRDSKRARERDFLNKVHETIQGGGKVLIPVFALGRAQELCILLESYWERLDLKVPIYFSHGLASRATEYYKLFINWTNEKIKETFVQRNVFDFKHIKPFNMQFVDAPGPMVVMNASRGSITESVQKWCGEERNSIIMPGYCAPGTVGAKVINGAKKVDIDAKSYEVNLRVEYMSFSAHADAKGIMQLIRDVEPRAVMFVHGENQKMEMLKARVEKEFGLEVFKPANGETVTVNSSARTYISVPEELIAKSIANCPSPAKRSCPFQAFLYLDKESNELSVISTEEAAKQLGKELHTFCFNEIFYTFDALLDLDKLGEKLRRLVDPKLQIKPDGIELFDGELLLAQVPGQEHRLEIIWDEHREHWLDTLLPLIPARKMEWTS
ncbi:hypothetical protein niasHT_007748 [Heterodera trifolii]|uniref:Integrator complex subunit 11 n=1 Tax=Heterodera trifolii TaxID=157864 RepID=A0ABD2MCQ7_9BILA